MLIDVCESRLSIHLQCTKLRNMDFIGRSDPFAILFIDQTGITRSNNQNDVVPSRNILRTSSAYKQRSHQWQKVGQTETILNSLNVNWTTSFEIPYFFERAQRLAIDVFDRDNFNQSNTNSDQQSIRLHDYLGSAEVSVPSIVRAPNQTLKVPLSILSSPNQNCGFVTIIAEEISEYKRRIHYNVKLHGLSRWTYFRYGPGPFLTISRPTGTSYDQPWINVLTTSLAARPSETEDGLTYEFPLLSCNYENFCRRNDNLPLHFQVSFEHRGNQRVIASSIASLMDIYNANGNLRLKLPRRKKRLPWIRSLPVQNISSPEDLGSDSSASLCFSNRRMTEDSTFLDYIMGGCEISLVIAIDFTASNGPPESPGTLHYADRLNPNEYETAIRYVGDILAEYDSDQRFPAYGFGAKLPPEYLQVSHKFPLSLDPSNPYCDTIDGVLNQYRATLHSIRMSGPSHLEDIIHVGADHADSEVSQTNQTYTILLILTDGVIEDTDSTMRAIDRASAKPLSIVIIGVGDADFTDMDFLDGDNRGRERDIVQFVRFRQFKDTPEVLRAQVLEEIPGQFEQYMKQRGITPNPVPTD